MEVQGQPRDYFSGHWMQQCQASNALANLYLIAHFSHSLDFTFFQVKVHKGKDRNFYDRDVIQNILFFDKIA